MDGKDDSVSTGTAHGDAARTESSDPAATLVGAEMLEWSDREPADERWPVGGSAASALLDATVGSGTTVLVAGPHALELVEQVATQATALDVLLRSVPDAQLVAERLPGRPVRTYAGGLDRFGPEHGAPAYDLIVALDGVRRLTGPDTQGLSWTDALALLRKRLAPGGRILLGVPNAFGLDRIVAVPRAVRGDDEWGRHVREEPPRGLGAVTAALSEAALSVEATYSLYADPTEPTLAVSDLTGPGTAAAVARAVARHYAGQPTLADPYRIGHDMVLAGHGTALAPGHWLVLGERISGPSTLPGRFGEDVAIPDGDLVEEVLLAAFRAGDEYVLHTGVQGYLGWLWSCDHETAAVATPDNVVATGSGYRLLSTHAARTERLEGTAGTHVQLAVRHLARFVTRALAAGGSWPWPVGATPRAQTGWLASIAGITVDDALWEATGIADTAVSPQGHAEQLSLIARLSAELAEARAQAEEFESQLHRLRSSRSYRVGRAIVGPLRAVYGKLRARLR
jgi:hypothetical protein